MAHKRTHQIAEQTKKNRADKRNKEKVWKRKGKIKALRSLLGPTLQCFRKVLDKLDLAEPHETVFLNKMLAHAETDPRFGCTEEENK